MAVFEGSLVATGLRLAVVVSRFNGFITERLLEGAIDTVRRHGGSADDVDIIRVPGAWELALAPDRVAGAGRYDAVLCLGCLIRGATSHFDQIASECAKGVAASMLRTGVPMTFGVLATDSLDHAIERAGTKAGNKGSEAASAAIELANLLRDLPAGG